MPSEQMFEPVHAIVSPPTLPLASQVWTLPSSHTASPGWQFTQPSSSLHATAHSSAVVHWPPTQDSRTAPAQRVEPSLHSGPGASGPSSSPGLLRPDGPHAIRNTASK